MPIAMGSDRWYDPHSTSSYKEKEQKKTIKWHDRKGCQGEYQNSTKINHFICTTVHNTGGQPASFHENLSIHWFVKTQYVEIYLIFLEILQ
jgi:hypothetical protein